MVASLDARDIAYKQDTYYKSCQKIIVLALDIDSIRAVPKKRQPAGRMCQ
jgi:hypothetical protein